MNASTIVPEEIYNLCWNEWSGAETFDWVIKDKMPIPFFGDVSAYRSAHTKVVTIGLNPSAYRTPNTTTHSRLPALETEARLRRYFRSTKELNRWPGWFAGYEDVLNGFGYSYLEGCEPEPRQVALHLDMCSPLATDPTWSSLPKAFRRNLEENGSLIFERLLKQLKPDLILVAASRRHVRSIWGDPYKEDWHSLCSLSKRLDGTKRRYPYRVKYRRKEGLPLIVFASGARTPFGGVAKIDRIEIGRAIGELLANLRQNF